MSKNKVGITGLTTKSYPWFSTKSSTQSKWLNAYFETRKQKHLLDLKNGYPVKKSKPSTDKAVVSESYEKKIRTIDDVGGCTLGLGLACLILLILTMIGSIIAVATPFWFETGTYNMGLFQLCNVNDKVCSDMSNYLASAPSHMKTTWRIVAGVDLAGSCLLLIAIISLGLFMRCVVVIDHRNISLSVFISIIAMLASIAFIAGTVLMATYNRDYAQSYSFGWSFYLAAGITGLSILNFILLVTYSCLLAFL